jgi:hypothetical protein
MREVYSDYLNDQLGEGSRLRLYTPASTRDTDLVQKIVLSVTDSVEYAGDEGSPHPYKVLFGDDLDEADSAYIFEVGTGRQAVSDLLNQIIVGWDEPIRTPPTWQSCGVTCWAGSRWSVR